MLYFLTLAAGTHSIRSAPCQAPVSTQAWSYLLDNSAGINQTRAINGTTGMVEFIGDTTTVLQSAVDGLPRSGGTVFLKSGVYELTSTVVINKNSVEVRGENSAGDLFFASDSFYNGFSNKTATLVIADGFDAFRVGDGTHCRNANPKGGFFMNGTRCLVLGTSFKNFAISGVTSDESMPNNVYSAGSGIRVQKADTIRFDNMDIRRKQYGLCFGQVLSPFEYDHVIDVVTLNNIYLAYNQYGLWQANWCV
jgi:hypothetical protein